MKKAFSGLLVFIRCFDPRSQTWKAISLFQLLLDFSLAKFFCGMVLLFILTSLK